MNINGIYAKNTSSSLDKIELKDKESSVVFEEGQVVEGIITKVSDKISIDFSGRELKFSKETIQNAKEGEIRKFEIMDVSEKSIVLKEIGGKEAERNYSMSSTRVETDKIIVDIKSQDSAKEDLIEEDLKDLKNRITEEDCKILSEGFSPIEEYNQERLHQALLRIKEHNDLIKETTSKQKEDLKEQEEVAKKIVKSIVSDSGVAERIAKRLIEADLPVTKENVKRIEAAMQMAGSITYIPDSAKAYLIQNELTPNLKNIYKSIYCGMGKEKLVSKDVLDQLLKSAEQIMNSVGVEVNEKSKSDANWLIRNDLPLTKENLSYKKKLDEIKVEDLKEISLEQSIASIKEGNSYEEADLSIKSRQKVEAVIYEFHSITDEAIHYAVGKASIKIRGENNLEVNLKELIDAKTELTNKWLNVSDPNKSNSTDASQHKTFQNTETKFLENGLNQEDYITVNTLKAKRQLEEIRLKLTVEAGQKLISKGILIETDGLTKIVDGLRELEDHYYKQFMQETKGSIETEDITLLKQSTEAFHQLQKSPSYLLGKTFYRREIITVSDLAKEGNALKAEVEKAESGYETVMTVPRKDLGDSIQKAFRNVDAILIDMNLETTDANRKAVRILGYNSMELSYENIAKMKLYDAKVNDMLTNMKPAVTAEMIKRGINPLMMTVDEVNEQATTLKEELGISKEEKYSNYLMRLEKQGAITKDERSAYIGVYRLLNQVIKSDGAVIGSVLKAGKEVTLNNLLTAVRTIKSKGVDAKIDDEFGVLEQLRIKGDSISDQILEGIKQKNANVLKEALTNKKLDESTILNDALKEVAITDNVTQKTSNALEEVGKTDTLTQYNNLIAREVFDDITPGKLKQVMEQSKNELGSMTIEQFYESMRQAQSVEESDANYYHEKLGEIKTIIKDSKDAVTFLKAYEIEDTLSMVSAAKQLEDGSSFLFKELSKLKKINHWAESLFDTLDDKGEFQKEYNAFAKEMKDTLNHAMDLESITFEQMNLLKGMSQSIRLVSSLSDREYYELPVVTEHGMTGMNITILHNSGETGRVQIRFNSTHGAIKTDIFIKNGEVMCSFLSETVAGIEEINKKELELTKEFEELSLSVKRMNYSTGKVMTSPLMSRNKSKSIYNEGYKQEKSNSTTDINLLYQVAKMIVSKMHL